MKKLFISNKPLKKVPFSLFLLLISVGNTAIPTYFSGDPVFLLGPVGQSMGGAVYSHKANHDNLLLNPAAGAFSSEYSAEGAFSTAAKTIGASVFDTKSTSYGGGLTYLRREVGSDEATKPLKAGSLKQTYQNIGVSMFGKLHESFSASLTGKYIIREGTGTADANAKVWNGDVGVAYRFNNKFGLGVAYKNVFGDSKSVEVTSIGGGAHFVIYEGVTLAAAIEKYSQPTSDPKFGVPDEDKISWSVAAQYAHGSGLAVRAALREAGPWDSKIAFGGISFEADQFQVAYSLGSTTKGDSFMVHTFSLGAKF